jgi:hypothetical protein
VLIFFLSVLSLFAQEISNPDDDQDSPDESDRIDYITTQNTRGDRNFIISLGVLFPVYFGGIENNRHGLKLGGTGSLAFNYFISPNFFIGGVLAGSFSGTRAGNMLYIVPLGGRLGYQFYFKRFEFPVSLMVGAAAQQYLEKGYLGVILQPAASVFWRFNQDWSFGFNTSWWFVPQWPKNGYNVSGNFLEMTLSARYHF